MRRLTVPPLLLAILLPLPPALAPRARAAQAGPPETRPPACDRARALSLAEEQAAEAEIIPDVPRRLAVMVRAADLLWPHRRRAARALFADAFDLASSHFRTQDESFRTERGRPDGKLPEHRITLPDQRFVVVRAVARRDAAWARELAARAARETAEGAGRAETDAAARQRIGQNLLLLAEDLWPADPAAAADAFRLSLAHPASYYLPHLLFKFAQTDYRFAGARFREALAAYAGGDIENLIYLSPFPFGYFRTVADVSVSAHIQPPPGFLPSVPAQRLYVETLLRAASARLGAAGVPDPRAADIGVTEQGQVYTALTALEPVIARTFPHLAEPAARLKAQAASAFREGQLSQLSTYARVSFAPKAGAAAGQSTPPGLENFLRSVSAEENPDRRDQQLVMGLMGRTLEDDREALTEAAQKIADPDTRRQFLDHMHFQLGQTAVHEGAVEEAARMAERVEALDLRALLLSVVARAALRLPGQRERGEPLLEAVARAAEKAPETELKARALLGLAELYAGLDHLRGGRALADAVASLNKLEAPELAAPHVRRRVEGRVFSVFMSYGVPGQSLDQAFRELGGRDFEGALAAAYGLDDKNLRALAVFALAGRCLEESGRKAAGAPPRPRRGREGPKPPQ